MKYKKAAIEELRENPFTMFSQDWALLSAGDRQSFNSMTVSWGSAGTLWGKPVATVYVRPQRYTLEFLQKNDLFTLSFFTPQQHGQLAPFGSKSGRDCDKYALAGMQPQFTGGTVFADGARLVLLCRKMSCQHMTPDSFIDGDIDTLWYPNRDYHQVIVGEVLEVLVQDAE